MCCVGAAGYLVDALDAPGEVSRALDWNLAGPGDSCGLRAVEYPRLLLSLLRQAAGGRLHWQRIASRMGTGRSVVLHVVWQLVHVCAFADGGDACLCSESF
jgi:hypothetical protein